MHLSRRELIPSRAHSASDPSAPARPDSKDFEIGCTCAIDIFHTIQEGKV